MMYLTRSGTRSRRGPIGGRLKALPRLRGGAQGFVLAAVLWLLAGLTVVAALASQYAVDAANSAHLLRMKAQAESDFLSSRSRVLYLLAATAVHVNGRVGAQTPLAVDDRLYGAQGASLVQVQDARGLINLNRMQPDVAQRFLANCGVPGKDIAPLLDKLLDYTDSDDLTRLQGAEAPAYREAGRAGPANALLTDVQELWQVLDWESVRPAWQAKGCDRAVTVLSDGGLNLNTAPLPVMLANGVSQAFAQAVVNQRARVAGADSLAQSYSDFNESADFFARTTLLIPGQIYRVTHHGALDAQLGRYSLEYWVVLRTRSPAEPWWVSSPTRSLSSSALMQATAPLPPFNSALDNATPNEPAIASPFFR
jgi:general secretion pathway protein K